MSTIKEILMERDGESSESADKLIASAQRFFNECLESGDTESAYETCNTFFGLEPDYIHELM